MHTNTKVHICHAIGCEIPVPPEMWGCRRHWFMVPKPIRDEIWRTYRMGQCDDKRPSIEYLIAALKAVNVVAQKEGKVCSGESIRKHYEAIAHTDRPLSLLDASGCLCASGDCEGCNALAEAWEAMTEALNWYRENAQNVLYHGEQYYHVDLAKRARTSLLLADKVMTRGR